VSVTWTKFGDEFFDEMALAELSDSAVRTHAEGIGWVYRVEATDLRIPMTMLRRFAGSPDYEAAVKELVASGHWGEDGGSYVIHHHAEVIRQSLAAQQAKREHDRQRQRRNRKASTNVTGDVTRDNDATSPRHRQTDIHTDSRERETGGTPFPAQCLGCDKLPRRSCSTCWDHRDLEMT